MNLDHAQPDRAARPQSTSQADTRLHGGWPILARVAWIVLVLFLLGTFIFSLPTYFAILYHPCTGEWCTFNSSGFLTASEIRLLPQYGLSLDAYAWSTIVINVGAALVWLGMGGILFWRKSDDWMALLIALMLIVLAYSGEWRATDEWPDRAVHPRPFSQWALFTNPLNAVAWFGCWILLTLAQLYRYFRVSNTLERQQTKWVAFSFFLVLLSLGGLALLFSPQPIQHNGLLTVLIPNTYSFISLLIPISLGLAMFRYRLWNIDIIINRTLVYGLLTASVSGLYALVVGALGTLLQVQGNFFIALLAAGLVAVLFQPLRLFLQRGVNRLMYGERDAPDKVISRLGKRLEITFAPDAVLPTIAETVATALKLPYAAITLRSISTTNSVLASEAEVQGRTLKQDGAFLPAAANGKLPEENLVHLPPLPAAVEVAIYRIAQEALTNVVRHANAQHCVLTLEVDNDICLEVRDDGLGFPVGYRVGVGLTSMHERVAELGGTCDREPVEAGGTRVFVQLPLPKEE